MGWVSRDTAQRIQNVGAGSIDDIMRMARTLYTDNPDKSSKKKKKQSVTASIEKRAAAERVLSSFARRVAKKKKNLLKGGAIGAAGVGALNAEALVGGLQNAYRYGRRALRVSDIVEDALENHENRPAPVVAGNQ